MKNNHRKLHGLITAAALFLAGAAFASTDDSGVGDEGFSIGPRATFFKPRDADKGTWYAGAQARLHLTPALGLEGSIDYRKNEYAGGVTIKGYPVQATLLAYLTPHAPLSPYLLGGAGWYYTQVSGPLIEKKTDNRFGVHAGAGLELRLNAALSIDGSYRYIWLADVTANNTNALEKTYRQNSSMVTAALNFLF